MTEIIKSASKEMGYLIRNKKRTIYDYNNKTPKQLYSALRGFIAVNNRLRNILIEQKLETRVLKRKLNMIEIKYNIKRNYGRSRK